MEREPEPDPLPDPATSNSEPYPDPESDPLPDVGSDSSNPLPDVGSDSSAPLPDVGSDSSAPLPDVGPATPDPLPDVSSDPEAVADPLPECEPLPPPDPLSLSSHSCPMQGVPGLSATEPEPEFREPSLDDNHRRIQRPEPRAYNQFPYADRRSSCEPRAQYRPANRTQERSQRDERVSRLPTARRRDFNNHSGAHELPRQASRHHSKHYD